MKPRAHESASGDFDAIAAEWIARRDAGLNAREEAELERWRSADARHEQAFSRFDATWSAMGRPRRTGTTNGLAEQLGRVARRERRRRAGVVGAGLAIMLAVGLSMWSARTTRKPVPYSSAQVVMFSPERHVLSDGSIVEHPPGAEFVVDFSGPLRRVSLRKGEALFQIAKNVERPFVVEAAGVEVRAIGTAFTVQLGREAVEVLVTEGTVRVDPLHRPIPPGTNANASDQGPKMPVLTVGQRAIVPLASTVLPPPIATIGPEEMVERLGWRNPRVEFSGAPFSDVIAVINKYNRVQFVIDDPTLARVPLSGLFRADDAEAFLHMLESGFGVKAERRSREQIALRRAQ